MSNTVSPVAGSQTCNAPRVSDPRLKRPDPAASSRLSGLKATQDAHSGMVNLWMSLPVAVCHTPITVPPDASATSVSSLLNA